MEQRLHQLYEFGPFRLDTTEHVLMRDGTKVALTPKAFETLVVLVERSGSLVTKDELMQTIWPETVVEEANLANNVWTLRRVLDGGDNGQSSQSYIETVPKRGYRFTADVRQVPNENLSVVWERHTRTSIVTEEETDSADQARPARSQIDHAGQFREKRPRSRTLLVAAGVTILLFAGIFGARSWFRNNQRQQAKTALSAPNLRSIAVLPFKSMDNDDEYLSQGISEALIAKLGNLRQLIVRPTTATQRYVATEDPIAAGEEQGVDAVLDGSVQSAGDRVRVTVQLLRVQDRAVLWAGQFDEKLSDIFALQDSISRQVAHGLTLTLNDEDQIRPRRPNPSLEAYQEYIKGRYFWNKRTQEGAQRAIAHFQRAIEIDPGYAQAYAGWADAMLFQWGKSLAEVRDTYARSKAALQKAIELDESLAEPHATLGLLAMNVDWNWEEAEKQYRRAIELNPNYPTAHHWYGEFLASTGRFDEGLAEVKRAQELDPLSLIISTDLSKVHFFRRDFDGAVEQAKKALELDPNFTMAHVWLGFAYSFQNKHNEAIAELQSAKGLPSVWSLSYLGYVYGRAGKREAALRLLKELEALSDKEYVPMLSATLIYIGLYEKDKAFVSFDRVFEEGTTTVVDLRVNPGYDPLRSDPRFADLLRRAKLQ